MANINEVRNTVLAIANKNNYGYITPQDFNLYAQQAQMDMFEDYFYMYNSWIQRQNARASGSGYADINKNLLEVMDFFSVHQTLGQPIATANVYTLPRDYYFINKVFHYSNLLFEGTTTATNNLQLIDANVIGWTTIPASAPTPPIGSLVVNTDTFAEAYVTGVVNSTTVNLSQNIFTAIGENYRIFDNTKIREVERVSQKKIFYLTNSKLTAPTNIFPAYVMEGDTITVYPSNLTARAGIRTQYIRYPRPPRWTFREVQLGEPIYDPSQPDFQDFELPDSDEPTLIAKICQYVGIEIREPEVYNFGKTEEDNETRETS
ncbi:MAG: hypothetical protein HRU18_18540 [Pseudoalteromonas sp.]|uniref:hypothetical protein n=1 Tax=Pseudoalteromonas sp. TaxID=53249 RepID=UPI001D95CFA1|nr:hypothetical protein [Pseudoalteromonas sp.]NRA80204.1 hypothetical protein [Pseudoalteromonas sp.]